MAKDKFSRELIFQQCNINRHCLCLHLNKVLFINSQSVSVLFVLRICDEEEYFHNYMCKKDTYGDIELMVFLSNTNPLLDSFSITINTSWIEEIEQINNNVQNNVAF